MITVDCNELLVQTTQPQIPTMKPLNSKAEHRQINEVADAFEDAWLAGKRPSIDDFLPDHLAEPQAAELFRTLVELDVFYCNANSIEFDAQALSARHPKHSGLIETVVRNERATSTTADSTPANSAVRSNEALFETREATATGTTSNTDSSNMAVGLTLSPGQDFGRYRIVRALGQGAMGSVFLAEDTILHRNVALKIPRFPEKDEEVVVRFHREAKSAAAIQHPNICQVFDIGVHDGFQFISMAYIAGKSLAEHLHSAHLPSEQEVTRIVGKLALALDEAHRQGVVHRDLKPANVMLSLQGEPVVMDFGLARKDSVTQSVQLTQPGMIVGSPAYMSPEQIRDSGEAGPSSDIYSLGIIMFQMLTGKTPFTGDLLSVIHKITSQAPPAPSSIRVDISPELERICLKAIEKRIEDRFTSMAEFAQALAEVHGLPTRLAGQTLNIDQNHDQLASLPASSSARSPERSPAPAAAPRPTSSAGKGRSRGPIGKVILAAGFGSLVLWLGTVFFIPTKKGTIRVEIDDPSIRVLLNSKGITITESDGAEPIEVSAAEQQKLKIERGDFTFETDAFALKNGEEARIKVELVEGDIIASRDGNRWQVFKSADLPPPPSPPGSENEAVPPLPPPVVNNGSTTAATSSGQPLNDQQIAELAALMDKGVRLYLTQQTEVQPPIRHIQPRLWSIDTGESRAITDDELRLLLSVVPESDRLILNTDRLTTAGWDLLSQNYSPELMISGTSLDQEAWQRIGNMTGLTGFEARYKELTDDQLEPIGRLVNLAIWDSSSIPSTVPA
jgi:serine/threonine protein kinase